MPRFFPESARLLAALLVMMGIMTCAPLLAQDEVEVPAEQPVVTSPLVQRLLTETFETPGDRLRAILLMIKVKHAFAARPLIEEMLAAQLDDQQLEALERRFGVATILELAAEPELEPQAHELAIQILAAARRMATNPQRLATLVDQLRADSLGQQRAAISELRRAGPNAVAPLLQVLSDPQAAEAHDKILLGLRSLGEDARGPLTATLDAPDIALRVAALRALGGSGEFDTVPLMLRALYSAQATEEEREAAAAAIARIAGSVPTMGEALQLLKHRIAQLQQNARLDPNTVANESELWRWDSMEGIAVGELADRHFATAVELSRIAGIALEIDPEDPEQRRAYLGSTLETAALLGGMNDAQVAFIIDQFGIDALDDFLRHSLDWPFLSGATLAAQLLGQHGTAELVYRDAPELTPLVSAATSVGDRRLRFAALESVMQLDPGRTYAGRGEVINSLAYFAGGYGKPRALVATTNPSHGYRLSSYLTRLGFVTEIYDHPGNLVRRALEDGDCELALIDVGFVRMTANDAISQLRADARTAKMPVGVVSSAVLEPKAQRLVRRYPLVGLVLNVDDAATVGKQVERLLASAYPREVTQDLRRTQAIGALGFLLRLSGEDHPQDLARVSEVVLAAMDDPEMALVAISILKTVGTDHTQRRLVAVASQTARPIDIREQAAAAFTINVLNHGTLLTSQEILQQYDRYNRSRNEDPETQQVLGSILDVMELRGDPIPETTKTMLQTR